MRAGFSADELLIGVREGPGRSGLLATGPGAEGVAAGAVPLPGTPQARMQPPADGVHIGAPHRLDVDPRRVHGDQFGAQSGGGCLPQAKPAGILDREPSRATAAMPCEVPQVMSTSLSRGMPRARRRYAAITTRSRGAPAAGGKTGGDQAGVVRTCCIERSQAVVGKPSTSGRRAADRRPTGSAAEHSFFRGLPAYPWIGGVRHAPRSRQQAEIMAFGEGRDQAGEHTGIRLSSQAGPQEGKNLIPVIAWR